MKKLEVSVCIATWSLLGCSNSNQKAEQPDKDGVSEPKKANTETKPQTLASSKHEAALESSLQTLILGKWRGASPPSIYEFTKDGVVIRTITLSGTIKADKVIPKDEPITLGSLVQKGKYAFVNDKKIRIAFEEAKSGGLSTAASEFDYDLARISATEMVGHIGTAEWRLERVKER